MRLVPLLIAGWLLGACAEPDPRERILLVTTTSVEASGLLDVLAEEFHTRQSRYRLSITAVGSGAALEMGRRGDADLLLTHHPEGEARFAADGRSLEQAPIMRNEFVLVGPEADPAGTRAAGDVIEAFLGIARSDGRFLSRGDDSGTHRRERQLWLDAGLEPWRERPAWYIEAGTGMAETLQMAGELRAYTLTDRATYLFLRHRLRLVPLVNDPARLDNPYTYTVPATAPNAAGGRALARWLATDAQAIIARHGVAEFGEALFQPAAEPADTAVPGPDAG